MYDRGPFNIALDEFAGSSFVTSEAVDEMQLEARRKKDPFFINGFGNNYSEPIKWKVDLTFENNVEVEFNIINSICDPIVPVSGNVYNLWPELSKYKERMTSALPRGSLKKDMLIGLKDLYKVLYTKIDVDKCKIKINKELGLKLEETFFGYVLKGGVTSALICDVGISRVKKVNENVNLCREIPMDHLLDKIFNQEICDNTIVDEDRKNTKFDSLSKQIFDENYKILRIDNDTYRFRVKLNRLPKEYYPIIDGNKYIPSVMVQNNKLEARLNNFNNQQLKSDFKDRIHGLIDDGVMKYVGEWDKCKERFNGVQENRKENILLPWQLVVNESKRSSETGSLRACLDASVQNKLLFRGSCNMTDITEMLIKWRVAKGGVR